MKYLLFILLLATSFATRAQDAPTRFDRTHGEFNALLHKHVRWSVAGTTRQVDYAGLLADRALLRRYLGSLTSVSSDEFATWPAADRQAFLINADNAATIDVVLARYPERRSSKELGGRFSSPWDQSFVVILGKSRSLDAIEHGLLRGAEDYRDPRIQFALNCASIGCPALRPEAYAGGRLHAQLDNQTRRFLRDASSNHDNARSGVLRVSQICNWDSDDWVRHAGGVHALLARYPVELGLNATAMGRWQSGQITLAYGEYDWTLNRSHP